MIAAVLVVRINRVHVKVNIVDYCKSNCITRTYTENYEVFEFLAWVFHCDFFSLHCVADHMFSFREEEVFSRADCLKVRRKLYAFFPLLEVCFASIVVYRQIQRLFCADELKQ